MSDAVSALKGARFDGFVQVSDAGLRGMITLRGDLKSAPVKAAVKAAVNLDVPGQRACSINGEMAVAWMSPDELLIMVPYADAEATVQTMQDALGDAHALVVNVSDARAVLQLNGAGTREVLAKLAPVDMRKSAFGPGEIRRTRMAQAAAAFWMLDDNTVEVICFRSMAQYMFDLLSVAAQPGSEVGHL